MHKARLSWMMFDWACSPISALHTTFVFAVYFTTVVMPEGGSFAWSQMTAITALLIAITAPFIGRLADNTGRLKSFLFACLLGASLATAGLWFVTPDSSTIWLALGLSALSIFTIETAFIFYNALLPSLAHPHKQGQLSGTAWGLGYIGAILSLMLVLVFLILPDTPLLSLKKQHLSQFAPQWFLQDYGLLSLAFHYFSMFEHHLHGRVLNPSCRRCYRQSEQRRKFPI